MTTRRLPTTLLLGLLIIAAAEALLLIDLINRDGAVAPRDTLPAPTTLLQAITHQAAINMTPICWVGYILILDGLLTRRRARTGAPPSPTSPPRARPRRIIACVLTSIPIWLFFDWINFGFIHAWEYHNLPANDVHRYLGYAVAFATINPAMFLSAQLFLPWLPHLPRAPSLAVPRTALPILIAIGAAALAAQFLIQSPIANLTLWLAFPLIFDPLNTLLGAPSILTDLRHARYRRLIALLAAGLLCGLLWEFWNYWAATKWTYSLPFLGSLESIRYFEMPLPGLAGFPPFAVGCWAAFNTMAHALRRLPPTLRPEPLPDSDTIL